MSFNNWDYAEALLPEHLFKDGFARIEAIQNIYKALEASERHKERRTKMVSSLSCIQGYLEGQKAASG
jgi:hypothetical protein